MPLLGKRVGHHLKASNETKLTGLPAAIWIEETDEVFFASMGGQPHRSKSDLSRNNKIFRICLKELAPGTSQESAVTEVIFYETPLDAPERRGLKFLQQLEIDSPHVQMTNGGTNYRDKVH